MAENYVSVETSEEMVIPLPLTQENLVRLEEEALTMEEGADMLRRLCPEVNIIPNVKGTCIPIIPGITLYSYLRFFNAFLAAPAIDIYVNGKKIASNLEYNAFTDYYKAFPGYYRVQVFESGKTEKPILVTFINLIGYRIYTAVVMGTGTEGSLKLVNDKIRSVPKESAFLRFIQTSPSAPVMDAYLEERLVLSEIDYREISRYLTTSIQPCLLRLTDYITDDTLLTEDLQLEEGNAYTVYIMGNMDGKKLQIFVEKEGISYLNF